MKRPLVPVALAYAGGLVMEDNFHPPVPWLFLAGFVLLAASWTSVRWPVPGRLVPSLRHVPLWLPVLFFAGWMNLAWRTDLQSDFDLRQHFSGDARIATLRGTLYWPPEERGRTYGERESVRTLAWLETEAVEDSSSWRRIEGRVLVITPDVLPESARRGARVEVTGVLSAPPGPEAPGLFDYRKYLSRQSIHFQLRASGPEDWNILEGKPLPLSQRFIGWCKATLSRGVQDQGQPLLLLHSMTLGARSSLDHEDYEPFIRTGTMHVFAISGLHIALISWMLLKVLRWLRVPRSYCGIIALPLIWFYTGATGWQPSAVRATIMSSVIILGWGLARPADLINSLCAAAMLILVWDPQQLFGASFQLSFFVVLSIALLLPRIELLRDRWLRHDPLLPEELVPRWQRWLYVPVRWLTNALAISLAAWLGAMPLTIYYFHLFTPITLAANVVIVPLSSVALGCNMGSIVFGDWLWPATELLNKAAVLLMAWIKHMSDRWAELRWGVAHVRTLSIPEVAAYYALLLGVFSGWLLRKPRCWWALGAVPAICTAWIAALHFMAPAAEITVLPSEGGMAIHSATRGQDMLIDCGKSNAVERLVIPFLRARGVNTLHGFVLTHGDARDMGGAEAVNDCFWTRRIYASDLKFRSPIYRACIERLAHSKRLARVGVGSTLGPWRVLHPLPRDKASSADEGALVLCGEFRGTRVLLLSDLNHAGQEKLMQRHPDLRADIVIAGLPSAGEPLCDALLEKVAPKFIIIGDSERPSYDRIKPSVAKRLRSRGAKLICTSTAGVTTIKIDADEEAKFRSSAGFTF